jgi:hypothetical protein
VFWHVPARLTIPFPVSRAGAEPRFEQCPCGFGLHDDPLPQLSAQRIGRGNLVIVIRELDGFAAGIDELFVQDAVFQAHCRVLCSGTAADGALL